MWSLSQTKPALGYIFSSFKQIKGFERENPPTGITVVIKVNNNHFLTKSRLRPAQWNNDHSQQGVKWADHSPGAMKTWVPAAVSSAGKVRPVAQRRAKYNIASSKSPAQCLYWEEQWWKACALSMAPRLQQGWLLGHRQHPGVPHGQGCAVHIDVQVIPLCHGRS